MLRAAFATLLTVSCLCTLSNAHSQQVYDVTAPQILSLTIPEAYADSTLGTASIKVQARITDDFSGLANTYASFVTVANGVYKALYAFFSPYNRVSGDGLDGIYETTIAIPQYIASGTYTLHDFSLVDSASNYAYVPENALSSTDFSRSFSVTSLNDLGVPQILSLKSLDFNLNVTSGTASVIVQARITDDLSGLGNADASFITVVDGSYQAFYASFNEGNRISGTSLDGIYETTVNIPSFNFDQTYLFHDIHLVDHASNYSYVPQNLLPNNDFDKNLISSSQPVSAPAPVVLMTTGIGLIALVRRRLKRPIIS